MAKQALYIHIMSTGELLPYSTDLVYTLWNSNKAYAIIFSDGSTTCCNL